MKLDWKRHFLWIDPRSRALFRISMGLVLIEEWIRHWVERKTFLYASGVLPPGVWQSPFSLLTHLSDGWSIDLFMLLGLVCTVAFTLGLFTRLSHILTFLFQLQIVFRNEPINNAGEVITSCFLFWTFFLPLNEVWSLDRKYFPSLQDWRPKKHWAALGIYIQFFVIYFAAALSKTGPFWSDGTALHYFWNLTFGGHLGLILAHFLPLFAIQILSSCSLAIEFLSPWAILLPFTRFPIRRWAAFALIAMHFGIDITFYTGGFQFASIASCFLLLDSGFWNSLQSKFKFNFLKSPQTLSNSHLPRALEKYVTAFLLIMTSLTLYTGASDCLRTRLNNSGLLPVPSLVDHVFKSLNMTQIWRMYAPQPGNLRRWWIFQATLKDGSQLDLITGKPPNLNRPDDIGGRMSRYWTRSVFIMPVPYFQKLAPPLVDYLFRSHPEVQISQLDLVFIDQTSPNPGYDTAYPLRVYSLYRKDFTQNSEQWFSFQALYNWNWEKQ